MIDFVGSNGNRIYFETEEDYLQIRGLLNDPVIKGEANRIDQVQQWRVIRDHFNFHDFHDFRYGDDGKYVEFGSEFRHIYKLLEKYISNELSSIRVAL